MACCCGGEKQQKILRWSLLGMTVLTWIFWIVALSHCTFVLIGADGQDKEDYFKMGMFRYAEFEASSSDYVCRPYTGDDKDLLLDGGQQAGRAFGILGSLCHTIAMMIFFMVQMCLARASTILWMVARGLIAFSTLCSVLIFAFFALEIEASVFGFNSDENFCDLDGADCVPGAASIVATVNIFLLVGVIVLSWLADAPEHPTFSVTRWGEEGGGLSEEDRKAAEERKAAKKAERDAKKAAKKAKKEEASAAAAAAPMVPAEQYSPAGGEAEEIVIGPDDVVTTRVEDTPEGRKTIREITHPDGSKTITTTIEAYEEEEEEVEA